MIMIMMNDYSADNMTHRMNARMKTIRVSHFLFVSFVCILVFFTIAHTIGASFSTTIPTASCSSLNRCNY